MPDPLPEPDPLQEADPLQHLVAAIRQGDLGAVTRLVTEDPALASARIPRPRGGSITPLHCVSDWPGYVPQGPAIARVLLEAGADPDARTGGARQPETPLHWTASSDDVEVAMVLLDGGADVEAPGGSIGTPLDNAIGYGCWHVARALVDRGAQVHALWQAAALGLMTRMEELMSGSEPPSVEELSEAFWQACHGGQRRAAEYLLARGADIDATPGYSDQTALDVAGAIDTRRETMVAWLEGRGAR